MFDSREIAKKALERASEIRAERKRRQKIIQNCTILSVFPVVPVCRIFLRKNTDNDQIVNCDN